MSLRKKATAGIFWTFAQQFGQQIVLFFVSTILARVLLPEEFGYIGMIAIFVSVGNALLKGGLTQSLIRSKNLEEDDYSTVFYYNLGASILIYAIIYLAAPFVSSFYGYTILTPIIRWYCLCFILFAFSAVQEAKLTKEMNFKIQTIISIPSVIIGGIVGIAMAYMGYGVWSIVWNQLITALVRSIQLWIYSKWSPGLIFNFVKFKEHLKFGYKITLSSLLENIFSNLYVIIIGKYFSAGQVGFYTRADSMKNLPVNNITLALTKVTYPLFSEIQYDNERLKRVYKQLMKMSIYVVAPIMIFLIILAEPVFTFLFTEKWLPAVPYFQILCISGILFPIQGYNANVLLVKGKSDTFLKLTAFNKFLLVLGIIIGLQFGIIGLLYAQVILSVITFFIYAYHTDKAIGYSAIQQLLDIFPIILLSAFPAIFVFLINIYLKDQSDLLRIVGGAGVGIVLYVGISYIFKVQSFKEIMEIVFKQKKISTSKR